jgi:hypothetical protein
VPPFVSRAVRFDGSQISPHARFARLRTRSCERWRSLFAQGKIFRARGTSPSKHSPRRNQFLNGVRGRKSATVEPGILVGLPVRSLNAVLTEPLKVAREFVQFLFGQGAVGIGVRHCDSILPRAAPVLETTTDGAGKLGFAVAGDLEVHRAAERRKRLQVWYTGLFGRIHRRARGICTQRRGRPPSVARGGT